MDTLSHCLAGSVLSRGSVDKPEARLAFWIGGIAAMVPDLDFLLISSRIDYLRDHRSWTHSFLTLPLLSLAIAGVAKPFLRRTPFVLLWIYAALGVLSHIVFDWITSFGTMFWTPLRSEERRV